MIINFYPEQDDIILEKSTDEYKHLWNTEGDKITKAIEKISGLKFKEKIINAVIYDDLSYSSPLRLAANISMDQKKGTLIHELCHRLVVGNNISIETDKSGKNWNMDIHKHIYLILYDIWVELYGQAFAEKEIDYEISLWSGKGISQYKLAWNWALSKNKDDRKKLWQDSLR